MLVNCKLSTPNKLVMRVVVVAQSGLPFKDFTALSPSNGATEYCKWMICLKNRHGSGCCSFKASVDPLLLLFLLLHQDFVCCFGWNCFGSGPVFYWCPADYTCLGCWFPSECYMRCRCNPLLLQVSSQALRRVL